jgi:RNA polymerase sigma factor (sigma-70 family)
MNSAKKMVQEFATAAAVEYQQRLRRYLRRRLRRQDDLDDLAQEVYLRLLRIKDEDQVARVREPMAYVYGVAARVIADWNGASDRYINDAAEDQSEECLDSELDDPAARLATQQHLERVFGKLSPMQAAALLLFERDGLSYAQISEQLKLSPGMVHYHITRARARIRTGLWDS